MRRVTKEELVRRIRRLNEEGMGIEMDHMSVGYRVSKAVGGRNLSPRLSANDMMLWLDAFEEGWTHHQEMSDA